MFRKPLKAFSRSQALRRLTCWLLMVYLRLVHVTSRWQRIGFETPQGLRDRGQGFIAAFWHNRMLLMPYCWDSAAPFHMLISAHPDGKFIADTVAHFGIDTIAGSTSKGGSQALRQLVKMLRQGGAVGITPDGPRGPRMRASDGIVGLARMAGVPVVPTTFAVSRRRVLPSWDRFILPLPFSRGIMIWGAPIHVPRNADPATLERLRAEIEDAMTAQCADVDQRCGQPPIAPAPPLAAPATLPAAE